LQTTTVAVILRPLHDMGHLYLRNLPRYRLHPGHRVWYSNGKDQEENEKGIDGIAEGIFQPIADNGGGLGVDKKVEEPLN
jgi:hypothetical protein